MDKGELAWSLLPAELRHRRPPNYEKAEELRLRLGYPPSILTAGRETPLPARPVEERDLLSVLERATGAAFHAAAGEMSRGYVSYKGIRIGLCGVMTAPGQGTGFSRYTSLAIRIPRQWRGCCDEVYRRLYAHGFCNTLLLSPPGGGKTTALRELVRLLSEAGYRVGLTDERDELWGFDLGPRCDCLRGREKAECVLMLLRTMNPQILAMDEISAPADARAVLEAVGCGVGILATAHAGDPDELFKRRLYRELLEENIFERLLTVSGVGKGREYRCYIRRPSGEWALC